MPSPTDDPAVVAALREVVDLLDDAGEAMRDAAAAVEDGGYSPLLVERLRAWAFVLESPRDHVKRVVGAEDAKGVRSQREVSGDGG